MDDHDNQKLLLEILANVKESRSGITSLDAIVRKLEPEVSGIQANAGRLEAAFAKHISDFERAREERANFDKRLALLENLFNEFLRRETKRDEREEDIEKDRRDARRVLVYFTVGQILAILLAVYAVIEGRR